MLIWSHRSLVWFQVTLVPRGTIFIFSSCVFSQIRVYLSHVNNVCLHKISGHMIDFNCQKCWLHHNYDGGGSRILQWMKWQSSGEGKSAFNKQTNYPSLMVLLATSRDNRANCPWTEGLTCLFVFSVTVTVNMWKQLHRGLEKSSCGWQRLWLCGFLYSIIDLSHEGTWLTWLCECFYLDTVQPS